MNDITSRDNQHLKFARAVRDGREPDWIFVEGLRLVDEAIRSKCSIAKCYFSRAFAKTPSGDEIVRQLEKPEADVFQLPDAVFRSIVDTDNPQGIVAIAKRPTNGKNSIETNLSKTETFLPVVVFLSEINNPSNLGAVLRTAEAAGAMGVITSTGSTDAYSPKAVRASMGSVFRLPVWENAERDAVFEWAARFKLRPTALDSGGTKTLYETDWRTPRLLIVGSEAHGLEQEILARAEDIIKIPMQPPVESLNLAVSCGITLFEAKRQNYQP